jgi:hypothetical protein
VTAGLVLVLLALLAGEVHAADRLADAQALFYDGRYAEASALAQTLSTDDRMMSIYELRTAALHFQIRAALEAGGRNRSKAFNSCLACREQMDQFMRELNAGQALARATLTQHPRDETALYFLGKLDLNYVWLVLGTLGRKTGWNEFWEARHSLDQLLTEHPDHLRGRVARAWIEYIVDTRMPWGTAWMLGGGNKRKALATMQDAANANGEFYDRAEAMFGWWEMQVREGNVDAALVAARRLASQFPENRGVARFIDQHPATTRNGR